METLLNLRGKLVEFIAFNCCYCQNERSPVLLGVGVCRLPITVTMGPTGNVEGRWSDLHT